MAMLLQELLALLDMWVRDMFKQLVDTVHWNSLSIGCVNHHTAGASG
jgi:hypothetical protein